MALGVEAAGVVAAAGGPAGGISVGDRVTTHSLPLHEQGAWAEKFIAAAEAMSQVRRGTHGAAVVLRPGAADDA